MGEAKRRKADIDRLKSARSEWLSSLSDDEMVIADVSERAFNRIVWSLRLTGGCYLMTFFLKEYLWQDKALRSDAVVGWVNDGTGPLMASHAWLEVGGKKIDINLALTEYPEVQPPGSVIILDHVIRPGKASYTYHLDRSAEAVLAEQKGSSSSREFAALCAMKNEEHIAMKARSTSDDLMGAYLRSAPPDRGYERFANLLA